MIVVREGRAMSCGFAMKWLTAAVATPADVRDPEGVREALRLLLQEFSAGISPLANEEVRRGELDRALLRTGRGALARRRLLRRAVDLAG